MNGLGCNQSRPVLVALVPSMESWVLGCKHVSIPHEPVLGRKNQLLLQQRNHVPCASLWRIELSAGNRHKPA